MQKRGVGSKDYQFYLENKKLFEDEVVYRIISFNAQTASHLITTFYDVATHDSIKKKLKREQKDNSMDPEKFMNVCDQLDQTSTPGPKKDGDYPLNVPGGGRHLLQKSEVMHNEVADLNMLTLKMVQAMKLLSACVLESYRLCPPVCSSLWVLNKTITTSSDDQILALLKELSVLNKGDYLGFCSSAVYEIETDPLLSTSSPSLSSDPPSFDSSDPNRSSPSKSDSALSPDLPDSDSSSTENSTLNFHNPTSDPVNPYFTTNTSPRTTSSPNEPLGFSVYSPLKNYSRNIAFHRDLEALNSKDYSLNLDFIRTFISHLLQRADYSTFEWGKPEVKDSFLLYPCLYNSSMLFRLTAKKS
ncbi:hypothetical protein AX774_g1250 [Zancudomyces culisetae]|uniref:Uncharacterized protein n=1 Tax=Zancudomyces culisetae TaxID=1213189 RepID=A0A1R1PW40_ZANCU|nr:hypothetical protein AX774_g1250 [Zancudomyces culisetae]|eukprot:OMH85190.1 hypothetical protein AX774_g1250 [Zancudomyces culisetae]